MLWADLTSLTGFTVKQWTDPPTGPASTATLWSDYYYWPFVYPDGDTAATPSLVQVQCHGCKGKGWVETLEGTMVHTCPVCKGDGRARLGTLTVTDDIGEWQTVTIPPDPDDTGSKDPRRPRTPHELESKFPKYNDGGFSEYSGLGSV